MLHSSDARTTTKGTRRRLRAIPRGHRQRTGDKRAFRDDWPLERGGFEKTNYQRLYPFLYSLDVFLPFVNLHQEHYWWPDADRSGECMIFGWKFGVHGSLVQYYLWLQIMSGWLLSAIFIAGITGLLRND